MDDVPTSDKYLRRKAEVRATAARLFRKYSFSGTSMDMIAAEIKLNKGTLYHYYKSKVDILYDIIIIPIRGLAELLDQQPAQGSVREQIAAIIEISVRQTSAWEDEVAVYFQESQYLPLWLSTEQLVTLRKYEGRYTERLRFLLRQGQGSGDIIQIDSSVVRQALAGMTGFLFAWFDPNGRLSPDDVAKMFSTLVLDGLVVRPES